MAEFCRAQGISWQTYYKWKKRFEAEGLDGLRERSRRPGTIPIATPAEIEDAIVRARKQLAEDGEFNGPVSMAARLEADGIAPVPSRATIAGSLPGAGRCVRNRANDPAAPTAAFRPGRPNEMWQPDSTEWHLLDRDGTSELVWSVMAAAIGAYGVPMSSLTDNGLCYTAARHPDHRPAAFQTSLAALGCQSIASTPYHPQTCGKIERFWQTLKKWLHARETGQGPTGC